jgi:hypothetical protein
LSKRGAGAVDLALFTLLWGGVAFAASALDTHLLALLG